MIRKFSASSRLIDGVLTQYPSTFIAFCELINNSIQAGSKNISIKVDYAKDTELTTILIKRIEITDDGCGVHLNDIQNKLLDIGDSHKKGGKGIGRFGALQIGAKVEIETIGYNEAQKSFSKVMIIPVSEQLFKEARKIHELEIDTKEEYLKGDHNTYYKVTITDLYDSTVTKNNIRHRITEKFLKENITFSIFERYPIPIFNRKVKFNLNGHAIDPSDFIINEPINIATSFSDKKDTEHKVFFQYFQLKPKFDSIRVFLTTKNEGIDTIAGGFEYKAEWLSPKMGSWFVYIYCESIPLDAYRNMNFGDLDEYGSSFKAFIKEN